MHNLLKSYDYFSGFGGLFLVVEFHWGGSANNGTTRLVYYLGFCAFFGILYLVQLCESPCKSMTGVYAQINSSQIDIKEKDFIQQIKQIRFVQLGCCRCEARASYVFGFGCGGSTRNVM